MIGLNLTHGKHAVVFKKYEAGKFIFLNPHRENEEVNDYLMIDE